MGIGLDRLVMQMLGAPTLRDVIAFPKVQNASELMSNCPSEVSPEQLKELTNMLPGADQTDGTAWGFLLQLADRISVLSEVSAAIQVDPNFDVDLSGLSLQNEYFTLSSAELDPETNVLNVKLNWVKQSAAIEPATANPICVVSGIKLTPKKDTAVLDSDILENSQNGIETVVKFGEKIGIAN